MSKDPQQQLSPIEKASQMNEKYSNSTNENFQYNMNSFEDLQGWRNRLVDLFLNIYDDISLIDLGCGLGDKSFRFVNSTSSQINSIHLVDFSSSSIDFVSDIFKKTVIDDKNIIVSDADEYLKKLNKDSVNLVFMFGFLHEVHGRKMLAMHLKKTLQNNFLILISDNLLHFKLRTLVSELKSVYEKNYVFRISKLFMDYKILYSMKPFMVRIIKHKGRTDKFLILTTNYPKYKLKNILQNKL